MEEGRDALGDEGTGDERGGPTALPGGMELGRYCGTKVSHVINNWECGINFWR